MSNLTDLVPPLELCRNIPEGEFEDSALVFACQPNDDDEEEEVNIFTRDMVEHLEKRWGGTPYTLYPAPTLQEIMAALPPYGKNEQILACCVPDWADFDARIFGEHWRVGYTGDCSINDKNPATAALKLWLKLKGIEE